jgi:tungstate transport system substrate-binding protein
LKLRTTAGLVVGIAVFLGPWGGSAAAGPAEHLRLATTTSANDSGLLRALNAPFEKAYHAKVDVYAVGSGEALEMGRKGDADVVLVHAPEAEVLFMTEGFGMDRRAVMHNDFVILGPDDDPAGVRDVGNPSVALARIAATESPFVSRGDGSGTYQRERVLWRAAGIRPGGAWYRKTGTGMGETLVTANEQGAYTLCDRGTYLAYDGGGMSLAVLVAGSIALFNPYHVILVNPTRHPGVRSDLAREYADYLTGPTGQDVIRAFRMTGRQLFFPDAIPVRPVEFEGAAP